MVKRWSILAREKGSVLILTHSSWWRCPCAGRRASEDARCHGPLAGQNPPAVGCWATDPCPAARSPGSSGGIWKTKAQKKIQSFFKVFGSLFFFTVSQSAKMCDTGGKNEEKWKGKVMKPAQEKTNALLGGRISKMWEDCSSYVARLKGAYPQPRRRGRKVFPSFFFSCRGKIYANLQNHFPAMFWLNRSLGDRIRRFRRKEKRKVVLIAGKKPSKIQCCLQEISSCQHTVPVSAKGRLLSTCPVEVSVFFAWRIPIFCDHVGLFFVGLVSSNWLAHCWAIWSSGGTKRWCWWRLCLNNDILWAKLYRCYKANFNV